MVSIREICQIKRELEDLGYSDLKLQMYIEGKLNDLQSDLQKTHDNESKLEKENNKDTY